MPEELTCRPFESFMPVPSRSLDETFKLVLVDPGWLHSNYGISNPLVVARTSFSSQENVDWSAYIEQNGRLDLLVTSKQAVFNRDSVDLISLIGMRLTLMSWQKLVVIFNDPLLHRTGIAFLQHINNEV